MKNKCLFLTGVTLIVLGLPWLFSMPASWPLSMVGVGGIFLLAAMLYRLGALAIPGTLIGGLGMLLFGQNLTGWWASWLYVWPLVPGLVGLGLVTASMLGMPGRRVRRAGTVWFVQALLMVGLMWFLRMLVPFWFSWALILVGLGAMFIIAAVLTGVGAQAIPGVIIGGLGMLLYWQDMTGLWASWSYAWALIPGYAGAGLVLANLLGMGGLTVRKVGLQMMAWSGVTFLVFGFFFAFGGRLIRLWPLWLVVLGVWILQASLARGHKSNSEVV